MKSQSIALKKDQVYCGIPVDLDTSKDIVSSKLNGEVYNKCFLVRVPPQLQESMNRPEKIYLFIPPDTFKEGDELEIMYENLCAS